MSTEFIIYTDESDSHGRFYSNFYGGAIIQSRYEREIVGSLKECKASQNLQGEIKWSKVTDQYLSKYKSVVDTFFNHVQKRQIKVRLMFTKNSNVPTGLTSFHRENKYFLLYHEFIKHGFGLQYCNPDGLQDISLRILFDKIPDASQKSTDFKRRLLNLNNDPDFVRNRIHINYEAVGEVDSRDHPVMQCLDVVLGAMQFRLNDKHLDKPIGSKRRARKTIAKERLYKHIRSRICEIYPNFNIGVSTSSQGDPHTRWLHLYSHWLFKPNNSNTVASLGKHYRQQK